MGNERKDMGGVMFKADAKVSDKSPDYSGDLMVNGETFRIAGWLRTSLKGNKFLSISARSSNGDTIPPAEGVQYDNSGVLFTKKEKSSDKAPDKNGNITIRGTKYKLSAWKRLAKNNNEFLSLAVSPEKMENDVTSGYNDVPF